MEKTTSDIKTINDLHEPLVEKSLQNTDNVIQNADVWLCCMCGTTNVSSRCDNCNHIKCDNCRDL